MTYTKTHCRLLQTFLLTMTIVMLLVGCNSDQHTTSSNDMLEKVSAQRNYTYLLHLADSLGEAGVISPGESSYWQGYAYYWMKQRRTAEYYWKEAMTLCEKSDKTEDLATYARSASFLVGLLIRYMDFPSVIKYSKLALEHLDQHKHTKSSDYTNLLIFFGCSQVYFNANDSMVNVVFEKAYQRHMDHISKNYSKDAYHDAVVGLINMSYSWISVKKYEAGALWTNRFGKLLEDYRARYPDDKAYLDKQWARYKIFTAIGLEGCHKRKQAERAFKDYERTDFSNTLEGQLDASDYLAISGKWSMAAKKLSNLNEHLANEQVDFSLEDIQKYMLRRFRANDKAGKKDTANAVAKQICELLDSAIIRSQRIDAEEQETIREKEDQLLLQQKRLTKSRTIGLFSAILLLSIFFTVYTIIRHRSQRHLAQAHKELKKAYSQLEETTTIKERMESELRIARDIQMSMVPSKFPKELDMFASMTPAKEVGGDLYGYLLQDDQLYFCIGDVSGKGVPASLFMAQTTRLFHTLASQQMMPAEICTRMNKELSGEDNVNGMFVTLFLGLLDLSTGHLSFCNAGHNPPVIDVRSQHAEMISMETNAPIGLWSELEYIGEEIDSIRGRSLFLYTDGLTEAENKQQEQFGDDRLVEFIRSHQFDDAQQVVAQLQQEVETHRQGAEPNDDLTLFCIFA